ncbi:hypothetical protein L6270_04530 [Candidatus Parcubacteria bacterium]|nr:hypothetical protein [Patescibacteria group bacterium]MBU4309229.1 hypothetical protein [Patescibacteria group bacterium]MBU4432327.1 hypothetical protein [Patescibacteria group bacterium]MBU4577590.1 hypothetical protein [Patescibacteria group bacterium]MCG2697277.1 hypothetical protein [Candidatus Parcubacteria bacterium]
MKKVEKEKEVIIALARHDQSLSEVMAAVCAVAVEAVRMDDIQLIFRTMTIFSADSPSTALTTLAHEVGIPVSTTQERRNILDLMLAMATTLESIGASKGAAAISRTVQKIHLDGYRTHDNFSETTDDSKKLHSNKAMGNIVLLNLHKK